MERLGGRGSEGLALDGTPRAKGVLPCGGGGGGGGLVGFAAVIRPVGFVCAPCDRLSAGFGGFNEEYEYE